MNTDDNDQNNSNKRDKSPSRQVPHPKKQAMDDDLNEMRAAATTAAAAAAAAAGAAASVLQEVGRALKLCMGVCAVSIKLPKNMESWPCSSLSSASVP